MVQERAPSRDGEQTPSRPAGALVEPTQRWIRVKLGHQVIADTRRGLLLIEYGGPGRLPTYYVPREDVRMDLLEPSAPAPDAGGLVYWNVKAGGTTAEEAAWAYATPPPERAALAGHVTFAWNKGLQWYEEDEEVFVHARDPHKRVDILRSTRHVQVVIGGQTIADTQRPTLLFETSLPVRYYIPEEDVQMDLLEPSNALTRCPYKGTASYWSARVGERTERNIVWSYRDPIDEAAKIKGLLAFFNEHVDLFVDGELQPRPRTPWSRD
jgi:uncharacterized protein (DUF427 family)